LKSISDEIEETGQSEWYEHNGKLSLPFTRIKPDNISVQKNEKSSLIRCKGGEKHTHFKQNSNTSDTEFKISDGDSKLKGRCCRRVTLVPVMFGFYDFSSHGYLYRFSDYQ
jgi:hypothetical protein